MRYMRLLASLLLLASCISLTGCGGGSSHGSATGTRKVTITVRWPSVASKVAGRVIPQAAQSVTVEAYDGTIRVGKLPMINKSATPSVTGAMDLPTKPLAFYVNAYSDSVDHLSVDGYVTDTSTGQPARLSGGKIQPLTASDPHPIARAFTSVDTPPADLYFTLANTISKFVPVQTTFSLDQGSVSLNTTVQAVTSDGAIVLTGPNALTWSMDAANALESKRAALSPLDPNLPAQTNPNGTVPLLNLLATGDVHVTVTDNEVTPDPVNNGNPIKNTLTITILPFTKSQTVTLNTAANAVLTNSVPLYAKSVTYTLSQDPLVPAGTGQVLDNPPAVFNSAPFAVTPVFEAANTSIKSVSLPAIPVPFTNTGRTLTLTVRAWSKADGTGALLADQTLASLTPGNATQDITLTTHVTGFSITPPNPTITINNTNTGFSGSGVNTLQAQVTALVSGNDPGSVPIDPRAVSLTSADQTIARVSIPLSPVDSNNNPFALLTGITDDPNNGVSSTSRPVAITATDKQHANLTGMTTLTVKRANAGFAFD